MKSILAQALAATAAVAAPLAARQSANIDPVVLQFALTLEHLENVFYKQALQKFSQADFVAAGFPADYRTKLTYIAGDEQSHVELLTSALSAAGAKPVAACQYKFPYTDVKGFVGLSSVIEGVGTSAYLGGAPLITSKDYLTVAGSILVTEALHTSYQRNAVGEIPFANAYGTPLDPTSVFSIAAAFIGQCPAGQYQLPFTPFPSLTVKTSASKRDWQPWTSSAAAAPVTQIADGQVQATKAPVTQISDGQVQATKTGSMPSATSAASMSAPAGPMAGSTVTFTASSVPAGSYITFISGLTITSVAGTISGTSISAVIPSTVMGGQTYVFLSKTKQETTFNGTNVLAGPAIIEVTPAAPMINYSEY